MGVASRLFLTLQLKMATLFRSGVSISRPTLIRRLVKLQWRSLSLSNTLGDIFDIESEEDFKKKVLEAKKPVVVDFHAIWCEPCRTLGPLLTKVVETRNNKVDLAKVNIDSHQELAIRYGVAAVPTVIVMRDGEMTASFLGLKGESEIEEFVPKD